MAEQIHNPTAQQLKDSGAEWAINTLVTNPIGGYFRFEQSTIDPNAVIITSIVTDEPVVHLAPAEDAAGVAAWHNVSVLYSRAYQGV